MLICAICGTHLRTQYLCSSVLSVGDSLCCLRFDSPTDSTDIHRFYIFQYLCSSVLSVGDSLCCLRFILPLIPQIFTDSIYSNIRVHPRYLWETPSHPISVLICAVYGRFLLLLEIYSPTDSTDFTDFIYPCIRVHPRYLWKTSPHPISVLICDICGSHHLQLEIYSPTDHRFSRILYILRAICDGFIYMMYMWEPDEINSH